MRSGFIVTVLATLLAAAVIMPVSGRLGDLYGKKLVLLASLGPLVVGSAVSALAGSLLPMVVGRGLQGWESASCGTFFPLIAAGAVFAGLLMALLVPRVRDRLDHAVAVVAPDERSELQV